MLGLSVWFSATAVVPSLRSGGVWADGRGLADRLGTDRVRRRGGHLRVLNLADRITPQCLLAASAWAPRRARRHWRCRSTVSAGAIPLRFLTGMFLAGVYPVEMKLMASWSTPAERGRAFGVLIGALTLGSALPHLIGGLGTCRGVA